MSQDTQDNPRLEAALDYADRGWLVVPLHWSKSPGCCSCVKGKDCPSPGKHPYGKEWQNLATNDPERITAFWEKHPLANVGVKLGPGSNLIDFETDDEEEEKGFLDLFGGEPPVTATFASARGKHRLFMWRGDLPGDAICTLGHLKVRIGNAKGAMSVFPPSTHPSGRTYEWLIHPDDCPPIELPMEVVTRIWNLSGEAPEGSNGKPTRPKSARMKLYEQPVILETLDGRDDVLYRESCALWREQMIIYGRSCLDSPQSQVTVYERLRAWNIAKCSPPLDDKVVLEKCESGRQFISRMSDIDEERGASLTSLGLEYREGEWWPGLWHTDVVDSDPRVVVLHAPFLDEIGVEINLTDFDEPKLVHKAVLYATSGAVCLSDCPGVWEAIWNGQAGNARKRVKPTIGVKAKILRAANRVAAPAETRRLAVISEAILDYLGERSLQEMGDADLAASRGLPCLDKDGNVMFRFKQMLSSITARDVCCDKITRGELSGALNKLGFTDKPIKSGSGRVVRWRMIDKETFDMISNTAGGCASCARVARKNEFAQPI